MAYVRIVVDLDVKSDPNDLRGEAIEQLHASLEEIKTAIEHALGCEPTSTVMGATVTVDEVQL